MLCHVRHTNVWLLLQKSILIHRAKCWNAASPLNHNHGPPSRHSPSFAAAESITCPNVGDVEEVGKLQFAFRAGGKGEFSVVGFRAMALIAVPMWRATATIVDHL